MSKWIKNWFSNMVVMADRPLVYQGISYWTTETFFQAIKTKDPVLRRKIARMSSFQAKRFARNMPIREDWDNIRVDIMHKAIEFKFRKGGPWWMELKKHPEPIVETNKWQYMQTHS